MRAFRSMLACAAFVLISAAASAQDLLKPPIRGLISMGPYEFVGEKNGAQPKNTLQPLRRFRGIFGGIVVVASWQQLEPTKGKVNVDVIKRMLTLIEAYNQRNPDRPLHVKLRVWAGFMAPKWAKELGGDNRPIHVKHKSGNGITRDRTLGRFWEPEYREAFRQLQRRLAEHFNDHPLIREVAVTQCMSMTSEPFFLPADILPPLVQNGFTDQAYRECLKHAVQDFEWWWRTRLVFAVNPYDSGSGQDLAYTKLLILGCRNSGAQCVIDNHDLTAPPLESVRELYHFIKEQGPEIEFQTYKENPPNLIDTIRRGVELGATGIEMYQDYGGFQCYPRSTLRYLANMIENNKPGAPPPGPPQPAELQASSRAAQPTAPGPCPWLIIVPTGTERYMRY